MQGVGARGPDIAMNTSSAGKVPIAPDLAPPALVAGMCYLDDALLWCLLLWLFRLSWRLDLTLTTVALDFRSDVSFEELCRV